MQLILTFAFCFILFVQIKCSLPAQADCVGSQKAKSGPRSCEIYNYINKIIGQHGE